jgi:hypothetical protein
MNAGRLLETPTSTPPSGPRTMRKDVQVAHLSGIHINSSQGTESRGDERKYGPRGTDGLIGPRGLESHVRAWEERWISS